MPKPFAVKYNRFSNGITSELRLNQEIPKFARTWNFRQTPDRLIQHMGMKELLNKPGHIVEYWSQDSISGNQQHIKQPNFVVIDEDLNATLFQAQCGHASSTISIGGGSLDMSVEPMYFSNHFIYKDDSGRVWAYQFNTDDLLGTPSGTLTELFAGEDFESNTFFTNMGSYVIVYGNRRIHIWDPYGLYGANLTAGGEYTLSQYMQVGDRNGNAGTYTGFLGPETQIISQVDELQQLLNLLGYGPVVVDGVLGPQTSAAISAFQTDNNATGNVPGGQASGDPLVVDGIVGPETQSALNAATSANGRNEYRSVITTTGDITAESNYGDFVAYATQERDGNANVFIWNTLIESNGFAGENVRTNVDLGQGAVQILAVVDGRLMAIMSPASDARCINHYNQLIIYGIESHLDSLPPSRAVMLAEYQLKISGFEDANFQRDRYNYINRKSQLLGGKLYFSGRLHLQHIENTEADEGAMSGVFYINRDGNLYFEVSRPADGNEFSDERIISFGVIDSGFAISSDTDTYITDASEDSIAGFITNIIDGDNHPYLNKTLDNIYLSLHNTSDLNNIEVWIREVEDVYDADAGWQLAYQSTGSSPVGEPTTEDKFLQRVVINRMEDGQRFAQFRELQVMVKVDGICSEITALYVTGYINDINE